jgi:hypothetical protein
MIDKVKMNKQVYVPLERFTSNNWRQFRFRGNTLYRHVNNQVNFYYSTRTGRLTITGRLYNLSDNRNRVGNLDLLYEGMAGIHIEQEAVTNVDGTVTTIYHARAYTQNLDQLIDRTNSYINELLDVNIDIRTFKVTYIEFCFNLQTSYVEAFCRMFNKVFRERQLAGYTNDVSRRRLPEDSGFYIRSNAQYRDSAGSRYTINFYNKLNQLSNLISRRESDYDPETYGDITGAVNILRMEVQVGYSALYQFYDQNELDRNFQAFLDPQVARDIIYRQYERIIGPQDSCFYSYQEACHVIDSSDYSRNLKRQIRQYLLHYVRHQHAPSRNTMFRYRKLLRDIGIHWCLIPSSYNLSMLESPIAMLDRHISDIETNRANMARIFFITELEAELYNSIKVEEEEEVLEIPNEVLDEL